MKDGKSPLKRTRALTLPGLGGQAPDWVRESLCFEHLPPGLAGKTVAFATDIHINRFWKDAAIDRLIGAIGAKAPDLILWGGDYAESDAHARRLFDAASALHPPLGMFGVLGNNDYEHFRGRLDELIKLMKRARVFPLINKASSLDVADGRITVAGADEFKHGHPSSRMLRGYVAKNELRVLLCHSPQSIDAAVMGIQKKPDLVFCGHTHGGQFSALGLTPYSIGYERGQRKDKRYFFVSGDKTIDGMRVFVSNGVGTSRLPLRVGARPQLHLFTLKN
jgi:predicted MPP superfamily phosphohydrolase